MKRLKFIKTCGLTCAGLAGASWLLEGCASAYSVQGTLNENTATGRTLSFAKSEFTQVKKNGERVARRNILLRHEKLKFPIAVYDDGNHQYTALWLECTHQGNEVNVQGDILSCPGHGSEFDRKGKVIQGPAKQALRSFQVTSDEQTVFVTLA